MTAWGEAVDHAHWELSTYVAGLHEEETTPRLETVRRWLVIDWLLRAAAPRWLRAAGLTDHAATLRSLAAAGSPAALAAAEPSIQAAARAAHQAHETAWYALAHRAHPDADDPDRARTWMAVVDGTQAAARCAWTLVEPAARATGYTTQPEGGGPAAWHAALDAITNAAAAITWDAAQTTTSQASWSWRAPPAAAKALAYTAARSALAPTEAAVQGAVCELIHVMFSMAGPSPASSQAQEGSPASVNPGQRPHRPSGRPDSPAPGRPRPTGAATGGNPRRRPGRQ